MADGRTHALVAAAIGVSGSLWALTLWDSYPVVSAGLIIGLTGGFFVTPDLDLEGRTEEERRLWKIPVIGFLWQWFWYGYALLFGHRGLSHVLVVGTATRVLYLLAMGALCEFVVWSGWWWASTIFAISPPAWTPLMLVRDGPINWQFYAAVFAAWCVQDGGHILFDSKAVKSLGYHRSAFVAFVACLVSVVWLVYGRFM